LEIKWALLQQEKRTQNYHSHKSLRRKSI
jgi:hypothetical protein